MCWFFTTLTVSSICKLVGYRCNINGFADDWTSIQQVDLANWERLGEGGFSRVFKARRTEGNETVAVKVLHEGALEGPLKEGKLLRYCKVMIIIL